jgi:hemolysin III
MPYPSHARRSERIADGAIHILGVTAACGGALLLLVWSLGQVSPGKGLAITIYATALVVTFVASAVYHMAPWDGMRPMLRRIDHSAIYLKIAGTYTPLVVIIGSFGSYLVLAIVWALAVFGVVKKVFFWRTPGRYDPLLYLFMGWLSLLLIWSLVPLVPLATTILITVGGLLYTIGVVFYSWEGLKFSNAIWHGFVLCASACFYGAITLGTFYNPA